MDMRREGMHGESSYGVRTPEKCVFSGSNPDISTDGPMVQRIERRFPMPEICVRFALGPQKCPRGIMESTKHYGCFGGGSNPPGGTNGVVALKMEKPLSYMSEGVAGPNPVRSAKYAHVGEWSKPMVCKTIQSLVRIQPCAQKNEYRYGKRGKTIN